MQELTTCLVCGNTQFSTLFSCKDFVATGESFQLQRCSNCSFLFTNPRPAENEIGKYYQSDKYISHTDKKSGLIYQVYDLVRDFSIHSKLSLIKKYHRSGKLLDLGCGLGYFLNGVKKDKTFDISGVDVSPEAVEYVKTTFGIEVKTESELDLFPENYFNVITQWHVLEHVHLLNERMQQLKRLLKPGGTLFIAVPNSNSWDAGAYKEYWDGYDVPRHLYHFNRKSFNLLMEKHGFEIVREKPLWFDAPYVSMRSEVHKGNKVLAVVWGAVCGVISNFRALFNGNFSSVLFVVKYKEPPLLN